MIGVRATVHILLHVAVPCLVSRLAFRQSFWRAWAVMMVVMIVDLDHLLADPVFDPNRCSIGFHPLHTVPAMGAYALMMVIPESRTVRWMGTGLVIHMALDALDCLLQAW